MVGILDYTSKVEIYFYTSKLGCRWAYQSILVLVEIYFYTLGIGLIRVQSRESTPGERLPAETRKQSTFNTLQLCFESSFHNNTFHLYIPICTLFLFQFVKSELELEPSLSTDMRKQSSALAGCSFSQSKGVYYSYIRIPL